MISSRHAQVSEDELRKEGEIEADENNERRKLSPPFRVEAPEHLRPPVVNSAEIGHYRSADHDVMEMRDDEIRVVDMHIDALRSQKESSHPADREQSDETECVQHRRLQPDRSFIER